MSGKTTLWDLTRHVLLLIIACLINFALLWVFAEWSEDQKEFEGFIGFWLFVLTLGAYFLLIRIVWEYVLNFVEWARTVEVQNLLILAKRPDGGLLINWQKPLIIPEKEGTQQTASE